MSAFVGDHMRLTTTDGQTTIEFGDKPFSSRVCGTCTLCCRIVPVKEIAKPAGQRCQHQRHGKGCAIYPTRPGSCRVWACRWLADDSATGLGRPDRSHLVVDMEEDTVTLTKEDGGDPIKVPVIQIWVDPAFPEALRAPSARRYMAKMAELHGLATIARFSSTEALVFFPPAINADGTWHVMGSNIDANRLPEARAVKVTVTPETRR